MRPWACLICTVAAAACGDDGVVRLRVDLPDDPTLSPLGPDTAAVLVLRAEADGVPPEVLSRSFDPAAGAMDFGDLPINDGVWVSVRAESPGGTLLGYGRSGAPVRVAAGVETTVEILLRKPFAFVTGAPRLQVMDTTSDPGKRFDGEATASTDPRAVVVTPDGWAVLVARGNGVQALATSDHQPISGTIDTGRAVRDLGISPDSRRAVALHDDGVTIIDLGGSDRTFVGIPGADGVAVSDTTAFVLVQAYTGSACAGQTSSIVAIPLEDPGSATAPMTLATAGADLAWEPRTGALLVAEPCEDGVARVEITGDVLATQLLLPVTDATAVAATRDRVFAVGRSNQGQGAFLILASASPDGTGATQVSLPVTEERARADEFSETGQDTEVRVTADQVLPRDFAVLPDGDRVAILIDAEFHGNEVWYTEPVFGIDILIIPEISMVTNEYQLLDASTGVALQRLRTYCNVDEIPSPSGETPVVESLSCTRNAGQDVSPYSFIPTHVAVTYGDR